MIFIVIGVIGMLGSFLGKFSPITFILSAGIALVGFVLHKNSEKIFDKSEKIIDKGARRIERTKVDLSPVGEGRRELTTLLKDKINESGGLWTVYYDVQNAPERIRITNREGVSKELILEEYGFPVLGPAATDIFNRIADDMHGEVTIDCEVIDRPGTGGGYIWTGDGIALEAYRENNQCGPTKSITVRSEEQLREQERILDEERKRAKAQIEAEKAKYKKIW